MTSSNNVNEDAAQPKKKRGRKTANVELAEKLIEKALKMPLKEQVFIYKSIQKNVLALLAELETQAAETKQAINQ